MKIWYTSGREKVLNETIKLSSGDIRLLPIDKTLYTATLAHVSLADIPAGARSAAGVTMLGKTFTAGSFDCADVSFPVIAQGKIVSAYVAYQHGATEADSWLLSYTDEQPDGSPINFSGNGSGLDALTPQGIVAIV